MGGKNKSTFEKILQKVTHQSDVSPPGLKKYDLVVVGAHIGGILTRHFEQFDHGHHTTYVAYDSQNNLQQFIRPFYERQEVADSKYYISAKLSMANYVASSDGVSVVQIFPERNTVKLENGTEIEYEQLVLALGMKEDNDDIKGFKEAWNDDMCPVYTTLNSTKWTAGHAKETRWIGNYNHGDAYFYIPKYPFKGEIAAYHFLQAWDYWEYYRKIGKLSPLSSLTVVNANDTFSQFDKEAHEYILKECTKRGIKVLFNTQLTEVKGNERKITLRNADGSSVDRDFNNLYVLPKAHVPDVFEKSGLAAENGLLDVDPVTLQARKYDNIYGIGDLVNLPITKSFWSAFHQMHVVRQNVVRAFKGQPPNAAYTGYSKTPFFIGSEKLIYFEKDRSGAQQLNLVGANSPWLAGRLFKHLKGFSGKVSNMHMGKHFGPPYGKFMPFGKYYKGKPISRSDDVRYTPETTSKHN